MHNTYSRTCECLQLERTCRLIESSNLKCKCSVVCINGSRDRAHPLRGSRTVPIEHPGVPCCGCSGFFPCYKIPTPLMNENAMKKSAFLHAVRTHKPVDVCA